MKPYKYHVRYREATREELAQDKAEEKEEQKLKSDIQTVVKRIEHTVNVYGEPHKPELKSVVDSNREILRTIPHWIDKETHSKGRAKYGIPDYILDALDKDLGNDITTTDVLTYVAREKIQKKLNQKVHYLELGISIGKSFVQMANIGDDNILATIDLEKPTPVLEGLFHDAKVVSSWRYYFANSAPRLDNDTYTTYNMEVGGHKNKVMYISGDVGDENSWFPLRDAKVQYNVMLSDAAHDPNSILAEMRFMLDFDLVDHNNFFFMWNALGGDMTNAFAQIFLQLQEKFPALNLDKTKNAKLLRVRNWLGVNEGHALNGMISSFDLNQLLEELK